MAKSGSEAGEKRIRKKSPKAPRAAKATVRARAKRAKPRKPRVDRKEEIEVVEPKQAVEEKVVEQVGVEALGPDAASERTWPLVRRGRAEGEKRKGRGFSIKELEEGGITVQAAKAMGLYLDLRRGTKHPENVSLLKRWVGS